MEEMFEALYAKAAPVNASITTMHRIRAVYLIFFICFLLSNNLVVFFSISSYNLVMPLHIYIALSAMSLSNS